jgi:aspartyl-tRNA synthetase
MTAPERPPAGPGAGAEGAGPGGLTWPEPAGLRDTWCGQLGAGDAGRRVRLCGWVARRRQHGEHLAFVDLRDRTGTIQCVVDGAHDLRSEYVLAVSGTVRARPEGTANPNLATGQVEVGDCSVEILARAEPPPFPVTDRVDADEVVRLRYRYVDLRRERMQANLALRARVNAAIRRAMDRQGFIEVETPLLWTPTPEGAREFAVPSRMQPGSFYVLPQSPQIAKQLLMVSGVDRYYQVARCLRDEDLRADRQFEFTQLDAEASFVTQDDVHRFISEAVLDAAEAATGVRPPPIEKMTWAEALDRYGTDKPDLRFGMELVDLTKELAGSDFRAFQAPAVKAIRVSGEGGLGRSRLDALVERAKALGARGLVWLRVVTGGVVGVPAPQVGPGLEATGTGDGAGAELEGPGIGRPGTDLDGPGAVLRHITPGERAGIIAATGAEPGDLLLIVAGEHHTTCRVLGQLRVELGRPPLWEGPHRYVWVVDFPLFEGLDEEGRPVAAHHPFTMPHPDDLDLLETDPLAVRSQSYDLVLNGWELGSGSIRIHRADIQSRVFTALGISAEQAESRFGFLLGAFRYGAPPHGGFAFGIDRLVALLAGEENIREVIAFPKTQSGADPMTGAPKALDPRSLAELGLVVRRH